MAFGSGEADICGSGSITVTSGNAHQQAGSIDMASSSMKIRVIIPQRSKRVPKGLCTTEIGEGSFYQDGGGHNVDMAAVGNNDRHVVGQEVQSRKTSDECNSDIAEMMFNQESNVAIRPNDMDDSTARGVTKKRNVEDSSSNKKRMKGTSARNESFEGRYKQLIDFIDEFGHCHVPCKYPVNPSLGEWCSKMRVAYKKIQQGQKSHSRSDRASRRDLFQMGTR